MNHILFDVRTENEVSGSSQAQGGESVDCITIFTFF